MESPLSQNFRVELTPKPGVGDARGVAAAAELRGAGLSEVENVACVRGFAIALRGGREAAGRVARAVLADAVTDDARVFGPDDPPPAAPARAHRVLVVKKLGVMDPAADGVLRAIQVSGESVTAVRTYHAYLVHGAVDRQRLRDAAARALGNEAIEQISVDDEPAVAPQAETRPAPFRRVEVDLGGSDERLAEVSREGGLSLTLLEMQAIRDHFAALKRKPTDVELETIAQTWSEHCKHKTLAGAVECDGRRWNNLLKETIFAATRELALPWCISVFVDNAGVIAFDDDFHVTFKVETHNHPSAIEPYGGAGTGIGGVLRDTLGTGLGARPIVSTDVFCFGPPDLPQSEVPQGALHPLRTLKGVVAGVRDYGNRMGIPTANGAILFDRRFTGNPLVFCGSVGLLPADKVEKAARAGDLVVVAGGRTGRDGIHGATFSSRELHSASETLDSGAVQIGNAITEKKLMDALLQARDQGLYSCVTDCGAGGLSSAVGEMGAELGAQVDLDKVPLKYDGLAYHEIWISEAQERMVFAVPPDRLDALLALFGSEDVEATVIGRFEATGRLKLAFRGETVGDLDLGFLHDGLPRVVRSATVQSSQHREPDVRAPADLTSTLEALLARPNVASKEWVIRQYDHEVQAGTVLKPLTGPGQRTPSDACVIRPRLDSFRGIAIGNGVNPSYGDIDCHAMALLAIDEAVRNVVAVGARADRIALLDNFCAGNCARPEILGQVTRVAEACREAALALRTPFISGKDSLNNEFRGEGGAIAIPTTLLVSSIGIVDDVRKTVSADLKRDGSRLLLVGETRAELGGSQYYAMLGHVGASVPRVDLARARDTFAAMSRLTAKGLLLACHDLSDGGLGVALAEMAFARRLGARVDLRAMARRGADRDDALLFSESPTRFLCEVAPEHQAAVERELAGLPFAAIGTTEAGGRIRVTGLNGAAAIDADVDALERRFRATLDLGARNPSKESQR